MLIGELAARSGLSRKAIRLYEAAGILDKPVRTAAGYRLYPEESLGLLTFVARARRLGLSLAEIRDIVGLRRAGHVPCAHVRQLLERKASDLEALLSELRVVLRSWRSRRTRTAAVCPHIETKGRR
jgi:DNA-binding transcriptional MerR regulator